MSAIDAAFAARLGLRVVNTGPVNTASSGNIPIVCDDFEIRLQVTDPATGGIAFAFDSLIVIGADFSGQGIDGLLGCDVLNSMVATFHGPKQQLTIAI